MTEAEIQAAITLAVGRGTSRVFRNNCGVATFPDGRKVRYGVANPGGSDLIGWQSVVITPEMVGQTIAIFTAIEVKTPTGRVKPEQTNFIRAVSAAGGRAGIARSVDDACAITTGRASAPTKDHASDATD